MLDISGNRIYLTRGDSAIIDLKIVDQSGADYEAATGDKIYFRLKKNVYDSSLIWVKEIDPATLKLEMTPEETASLDFASYRYEIELVTAQGYRFTVIENAQLTIGIELGENT